MSSTSNIVGLITITLLLALFLFFYRKLRINLLLNKKTTLVPQLNLP